MRDPCSADPRGTMVEVWVVPGASRDEITGRHGDALRVRVAAPPEGGRANAAVAALLAASSGARAAEVVSGHGSRRKRVLLEGIGPAAARRALLGSDD